MHKKITIGFVIQNYVTVGGKHVCVDQEFIAGEVSYEDEFGESVVIDTTKENYQTFDMMNPPRQLGTNGLSFTCPKCSGHRLECCEDGPYSSEVLCINEEGDFDYGEISASGDVDRFQCLDCGFILSYAEYNLTDNDEVVDWILAHCEQKEKK